MNIAFRVDASMQIGSGHVMRCITLAEALRDRGANCSFISRDFTGNLFDRIRQSGFNVFSLPADDRADINHLPPEQTALAHGDWLGVNYVTDSAQTIALLGGYRCNWLIVDHYALDRQWEAKLRPYCERIMVIDDLADRLHDCDLLLDQNLIVNQDRRYDDLVPTNCGRLLGPAYALLQSSYGVLHKCTPPRLGSVQRILVSFGGSDRQNVTGRVLNAFLVLDRLDIALDVVVNPGSPFLAELREKVAMYENVALHEGLPSLSELMVRADLAIGAGGATSWERICLGLPTMVVTLAENQKPIAEELDRQGLVRWLGDESFVADPTIAEELSNLISDRSWRQHCSSRCLALLDGKGTARVADILLLKPTTPFTVRPALPDDESLLLKWLNDPVVRKNSFDTKTIDADTHRNRFFKKLRSPDSTQIFILQTESGLPIGQVRFERRDDAWEISYSLAAMARGRGLSAPFLQAAICEFRRARKNSLVFGRVKHSNYESQRVFQRLGFQISEAEGRSGEVSSQDDGLVKRKARGGRLSISICSDSSSWMNSWIPQLLLDWLSHGHKCSWTNDASQLTGGDICVYLSYGRVVGKDIRSKYRNNLVVHASDLPRGRGWSPTTWMILDGQTQIPVCLFEAVDAVDAGAVYAKEWFRIEPTDLVEDWRGKLAKSTFALLYSFVKDYPSSLNLAKPQTGEPSFYPRRRREHSMLDPNKTLKDQFRLFQVVDNDLYPAYFEHNGQEYFLKVFSGRTIPSSV
jgi:UDP-2,4-diacetamido-2,4,6-trideoxy-beta-L-altropyranose hydrolase